MRIFNRTTVKTTLANDADAASVSADVKEEARDSESMRTEARAAARRYEVAATFAAKTDQARARRYWREAAAAYRRGRSWARAKTCAAKGTEPS